MRRTPLTKLSTPSMQVCYAVQDHAQDLVSPSLTGINCVHNKARLCTAKHKALLYCGALPAKLCIHHNNQMSVKYGKLLHVK